MHYDRTVIAYHGCSVEAAERILSGDDFRPSQNLYDWLGHGVYFWEYGLARALRWAKEKHGGEGAAVGAIVQLGECFDLMDTRFTRLLSDYAPEFIKALNASGTPTPKNKGKDLKARRFDCALINWTLNRLKQQNFKYQTIRCGFAEGDRIYSSEEASSEILLESHIQLAVLDPASIVGTFRPRISGTLA